MIKSFKNGDIEKGRRKFRGSTFDCTLLIVHFEFFTSSVDIECVFCLLLWSSWQSASLPRTIGDPALRTVSPVFVKTNRPVLASARGFFGKIPCLVRVNKPWLWLCLCQSRPRKHSVINTQGSVRGCNAFSLGAAPRGIQTRRPLATIIARVEIVSLGVLVVPTPIRSILPTCALRSTAGVRIVVTV